jgi:catechol 2,3-dioxygenase-like lactoylglutathione lyase family enzyme
VWSIGTSPLRMRLHIAFQVELPQVFASVQALLAAGLTPLDQGGGQSIEEPLVLCWMPAASVYFDDPDGHSLEFICMLDEAPRPELGRVAWSEWRRQA